VCSSDLPPERHVVPGVARTGELRAERPVVDALLVAAG